MIDYTAERAKLIAHLRHRIKDARVLDAMARLPRELFVPEKGRDLTYEDHPLPIWVKQTISQPYIAAAMTKDLLAQLAVGGRMVIPAGTRFEQELLKVTKHAKSTDVIKFCDCRFVALIGKDAWQN